MINMLIEALMLTKMWPIYALLVITALYFIVWDIIERINTLNEREVQNNDYDVSCKGRAL